VKKVAGTTTREAATAIPPIVDDVRVQVALAIPVVEIENMEVAVRITPVVMHPPSSVPLPFECSRGCIVFGISNARTRDAKCLHFFDE